ncbi:uncharacterized protein [Coffea arabica]|uniref:CRM domain-containing protein n=1 Tax=Coffea arabica TaxID=13443 RepID=A0A6P6WDX0_COFAR|nr:uncharacterized protein LOC113731223 [Coffea arabica]
MLLHRILLRPTPLPCFPLLQKSVTLEKTTSLSTTSMSSFPTLSPRFLPFSRSWFCARFCSEGLLEVPKDVESSSPYDDEIESEDGDIGAETSQVALDSARGLDRVLEAGTDKELKRNASAKLPNLSVKEKKELASYAQSLGKKLKSQQVGKSGVSHTVVMALIETLEANELLKLKIHNTCPGELDEVVQQIEEGTGSVVVGRIGRTAILYRPSLTKLKVEEKKKRSRSRLLVKKQPTLRQIQNKSQRPRQSTRGRRGSGRASG